MLDDLEISECEACEVAYGSPECEYCPFYRDYEVCEEVGDIDKFD